MDDAQLVREFQRTADPASFGELVARHREQVFRLVVSILGRGREGEAEELTQDIFVKVHHKLDQFRGEAAFSSWVYRIAYNQALDQRSTLRFKARHVSEEALTMTPTSDRTADPLDNALSSDLEETVEECLDELPDLYRSILHLHYWLGMTVAEISDTLSTPTGTIKSYMHRARAKLAGLLEERGVSDA